jgi:hypothetical protein
MSNNIPTTTDLKHNNRNKFLRNIFASIIGSKKVGSNDNPDELNDDALVIHKFKPVPTINNNTVKINANPVYNEYNRIGGKPKKSRKSRKSRKTRKNRKSKRKL